MQYELSNLRKNNISLSRNQIFPIIGLYFFVLGTSLLGFSVYLFLESAGLVEQTLINWNGQGLFWSFITFFASLFILFIPVEFFDKYFIEELHKLLKSCDRQFQHPILRKRTFMKESTIKLCFQLPKR